MKNKNVINSYKKAIRVIDSCENQHHLEVANHYINNFLLAYSKGREYNEFGLETIEPDEFAAVAYTRLRNLLNERKDSLGNGG